MGRKRASSDALPNWCKRHFQPGDLVELRVFPNGRGKMEAREWVRTTEAFCDFVAAFDGKDANLAIYYAPASRVRRGGTKDDVSHTHMLWAEIDCDKLGWDSVETAKVVHGLPGSLQPSCCIHSGHGLHLYWYLSCPADDRATVEGVNTLLRDMVSGDNVQNIDRVMRVPFTWNTKDKPVQARVLWQYHWSTTTIEELHDLVADFDRVLDVDGFVSRKVWQRREDKRRADATDPDKVYAIGCEDRRKKVNARGLAVWGNTRYGGGPGYYGLDEAIMLYTAQCYCRLTAPTQEKLDQIVRDTLEKVREVHARDASGETWDWQEETREVQQKLMRWVKRWDQIKGSTHGRGSKGKS